MTQMDLEKIGFTETLSKNFDSVTVSITREAGWNRIRVFVHADHGNPFVTNDYIVLVDIDIQERKHVMGVLAGAATMSQSIGYTNTAEDINAAANWVRNLSNEV